MTRVRKNKIKRRMCKKYLELATSYSTAMATERTELRFFTSVLTPSSPPGLLTETLASTLQ